MESTHFAFAFGSLKLSSSFVPGIFTIKRREQPLPLKQSCFLFRQIAARQTTKRITAKTTSRAIIQPLILPAAVDPPPRRASRETGILKTKNHKNNEGINSQLCSELILQLEINLPVLVLFPDGENLQPGDETIGNSVVLSSALESEVFPGLSNLKRRITVISSHETNLEVVLINCKDNIPRWARSRLRTIMHRDDGIVTLCILNS